jgi:hypothetical protein
LPAALPACWLSVLAFPSIIPRSNCAQSAGWAKGRTACGRIVLRGTSLRVHEIARNELQPGENWDYPESRGYFAGLRWARLDGAGGPSWVASTQPGFYLRVGTPRFSLLNTSPDSPTGEFPFLHAIPAIGSKFIAPEKQWPAEPVESGIGAHMGSLVFRFGR